MSFFFVFGHSAGQRSCIGTEERRVDLLGAIENGAKSPDWMGDSNILTSGHVFLALVYLAICYGLSRYSRRLEIQR